MLKRALSVRVGLTSDQLVSARRFNDQKQDQGEVSDYAKEFKRFYNQTYSGEDTQSIVLGQRFLTGLQAPNSQQLLLKYPFHTDLRKWGEPGFNPG